MNAYTPIAVIGGVPVGNRIDFLHPNQKITISSYTDEVWAILRLCDGSTSQDEIVRKVAKRFNRNRLLIEQIIEDLTQLEILVDSRRAYQYYHRLGNNLSSFGFALSPEEVYAVQSSDHLPLRKGRVIQLDDTVETMVGKLGSNRRSCRNFSLQTVSQSQLSEILLVGNSKHVTAAPSAGGLDPIRVFAILTRDLENHDSGIYEYDGSSHTLVKYVDKIDEHELEYSLNSDTLLYGAPVIFVIAAELDRSPTKYANRGYRYSLIEAGHVAQNIHFTSQELGLSTLEYCGFQDDVLSEVLQIKDEGIVPILTVAVGYDGAEDSVSTDAFAANLTTELVGKGKPVNWVSLINSPQNDGDYSFFHFISHFRSGDHDNPKISYKGRLCGGTSESFHMATIKAIAEGYERHQSGKIRIDATCAASELDSVSWLDPRVYAPYSSDQVSRISSLTQFDEDIPWEWTKAYGQADGRTYMVPIDLVYYPLSEKRLGRQLCHYANSSGIAAHSTYELATKGALLELIERDAIMHNWFTKSIPSRVHVDDLPLHWRKRAVYWKSQGYEVEFLNFSSGGVATISVVMHSTRSYPFFVSGTSSSIDSLDSAYTKAFHEAELTLITLRQQGDKDISVQQLAEPIEHGLLYAKKEFQHSVDYLWSGCYDIISEPTATFDSLIHRFNPCVVDLSGSSKLLKVVRVFAEDLMPVNFGYGVDHTTHHSLPESIRKKHYSELEPHYLA